MERITYQRVAREAVCLFKAEEEAHKAWKARKASGEGDLSLGQVDTSGASAPDDSAPGGEMSYGESWFREADVKVVHSSNKCGDEDWPSSGDELSPLTHPPLLADGRWRQ